MICKNCSKKGAKEEKIIVKNNENINLMNLPFCEECKNSLWNYSIFVDSKILNLLELNNNIVMPVEILDYIGIITKNITMKIIINLIKYHYGFKHNNTWIQKIGLTLKEISQNINESEIRIEKIIKKINGMIYIENDKIYLCKENPTPTPIEIKIESKTIENCQEKKELRQIVVPPPVEKELSDYNLYDISMRMFSEYNLKDISKSFFSRSLREAKLLKNDGDIKLEDLFKCIRGVYEDSISKKYDGMVFDGDELPMTLKYYSLPQIGRTLNIINKNKNEWNLPFNKEDIDISQREMNIKDIIKLYKNGTLLFSEEFKEKKREIDKKHKVFVRIILEAKNDCRINDEEYKNFIKEAGDNWIDTPPSIDIMRKYAYMYKEDKK